MDGSPNFRMVSEFVNEFESSYRLLDNRDELTKQRVIESGIVYNQTMPDLMPGYCIFELKAKKI
jgi:hypothetical protein